MKSLAGYNLIFYFLPSEFSKLCSLSIFPDLLSSVVVPVPGKATPEGDLTKSFGRFISENNHNVKRCHERLFVEPMP